MQRRGNWIAAALVASLGMAVTSGALADPTTLTFLTDGSAGYLQTTKAFFAAYEQLHPEIKIDIQVGGLDKFVAEAAAGNPPDLVRLYGQNVPEYAAKGLISDLTPYLTTSTSVNAADLVPAVRDQGLSYNGHIYALSFGVSLITLFYNKDAFSEAGVGFPDRSWSWENQGLAAGKKLVKMSPDGKVTRSAFQTPSSYQYYPFIFSDGGRLFDGANQKVLFDSAEAAAGLQFARDLRWQYHVIAQPNDPNDFASGSTAAAYVGSWYVTELQNAKVPFKWDVAYLPSLGGRSGTVTWPETPIAIPTGVKHPDLSWQVLQFIGSEAGQKLLTESGVAMPPLNLKVGRGAFYTEHPELATQELVDLAVAADTQALPTAPGAARTPLQNAVAQVMNNQMAPAQALAGAAKVAQAALDDFWKSLGGGK